LHSPLLLALSKSLENPLSIFRFPGLFIQNGKLVVCGVLVWAQLNGSSKLSLGFFDAPLFGK